MKLITISGPPSSGKTSVILRTVEQMGKTGGVMVVKFDCLSSTDQERYQGAGIQAITGLSGNQCPDHFYISNIEDCVTGARAPLTWPGKCSRAPCWRAGSRESGCASPCLPPFAPTVWEKPGSGRNI